MYKSRTLRTWAVLLLTLLLFTACAPAPAAPAPAAPADSDAEPATVGGELLVVETGGYYSTDPFVTPWFTTVHSSLYDALVTTDVERKFVPHLAESFSFSDDGLTVTFQLRQDVTFHDGTPFDAAAAKWNFDRYFNPESGAQVGSNLRRQVESVEAPDDYTLVFNLLNPYAPILSDIFIIYMVSPTAYEELGRDNFGMSPVGTGKFRAVEVVPDSHVTMVRNEDYTWSPAFADNAGAVPAEGMRVGYLTDEAVIFSALETGELNVVPVVPAQYIAAAEANDEITINQGIGAGVWYIGMNWGKAPFTDEAVRLAISYAIDREEIVLAGFDGEAYPLAGPLSPSIAGFNPDMEAYGQEKSNNIELARQLLAEAGYTAGDDGVLAKDDVRLAFSLIYPDSAALQRVAETIQSQLVDIGIEVDISPLEAAAIADLTNRCEQEAFLRTFGYPDATILAHIKGPNIGTGNRLCLNSDEYDELMTIADSTMDPVARQAAIDAVATWLIDNRPLIPLYAPINNAGARTEVVGIEFDVAGNPIYFNAGIGN
jgi:peptide/nickel transport system substrate-binding protein